MRKKISLELFRRMFYFPWFCEFETNILSMIIGKNRFFLQQQLLPKSFEGRTEEFSNKEERRYKGDYGSGK